MWRRYTFGCDKCKVLYTPHRDYSPIFNKELSIAIQCIERLMEGFVLVSGSSVLAEALRTVRRDPRTIFVPNDIDIYIPWEKVLSFLYFLSNEYMTRSDEKKVAGFLEQVFRHFREYGLVAEGVEHKYFQRHPHGHPYYDMFEFQEMKSMTVFRIKDCVTDTVHPVKIQLMILGYKDFGNFTGDYKDWTCDILNNYDINIVKAAYSSMYRTIWFPTDPNIYDYIKAGKFYYNVARYMNKDMLLRIHKYVRRGFTFAGYYDEANGIVQLASTNQLLGQGSPDDIFLGPRSQPSPPGPCTDFHK
jgi:hypothetical protein